MPQITENTSSTTSFEGDTFMTLRQRDYFAQAAYMPCILDWRDLMGLPVDTPLEKVSYYKLCTDAEDAGKPRPERGAKGTKSVQEYYEELPGDRRRELIARHRFMVADAMMKARAEVSKS